MIEYSILVFSGLNFSLQIVFELGSGGSLLSDSEDSDPFSVKELELTAEVNEFGLRKLRISIHFSYCSFHLHE